MTESLLSGLHRMPASERIRTLVECGFLSEGDARDLLSGAPLLPTVTADRMIENVIGVFGLPFAVAPNFLVNGKDYIVPMVVEEPSIVAGVSGAAKTFREGGGFFATSTDPVLTGQIQITNIDEPDRVVQSLYAAEQELLDLANSLQPNLLERGGGARGAEYYKYRMPDGRWTVVLHLLVDTRDAMGANIVNTMCEGVAARVEAVCGGKVVLRILSNLADKSMVSVRGSIPIGCLGFDGYSGREVSESIALANDLAMSDPYRAATHNKGIMNGIDALAIATGNDWRAIEAGAHAFAARDGRYRSLTTWSVTSDEELSGELVLPLKVGIVGGSLSSNPGASKGLSITGVASATELAELMAATGLAQNFAALRALVSVGIQKGHMSLHARSVAATAGVPDKIFDEVVEALIESGDIKTRKAKELAESLRQVEQSVETVRGSASVGKAAGKVILLGEHAAVYDRHALALPINEAVTASIDHRDSGVSLSIPVWDIHEEWAHDDQVTDGAAAVVALITRELGLSGSGFDITVSSRIPLGMGLGSSAAFAVAIIRAFDHLLSLGKSDVEVDQLGFRCEELTHGTPSGIDNNIATFGEPVLYSKGSQTRTKAVVLSEIPPLVVASSATSGTTRDMVTGVRERYERNRELYSTIFDEMDEIAVAGAIALRECDYQQLGLMMNVCHGFLNAIEVSTPELEKMISIAREAGAVGAKLTGAGGGGSIVALCPGRVDDVATAIQGAGYQLVKMSGNKD